MLVRTLAWEPAILVAVAVASVRHDSGITPLSGAEAQETRGAAVTRLVQGGIPGSKPGNCTNTWTCDAANPDPACGFKSHGVCVPAPTTCVSRAPCRTTTFAVYRCEGVVGSCDTSAGGILTLQCPTHPAEPVNFGQCTNPTGGANCVCVDQAVPDYSDYCDPITNEC